MAFLDFLNDEERRKRLMLTPGINPNPPATLPNIPAPRPLPAPAHSIPGGVPGEMPGTRRDPSLPDIQPKPAPPGLMARGNPAAVPMPAFARPPQTRYEEMGEAKDVYLKGTPGRLKSGLLGIAQGALRGLATGGLGGAIGGAATGGVLGAANPRGQREQQFEQQVRPKILERFAYEDADRATAIAQSKAAGDQAMNQAQLRNIQSQINSRDAQDALNKQKAEQEAGQPLVYKPGDYVVSRRGGEKPFQVPITPKTPTEAELSVEPSSGKSAEEISDDSYQGRGGDQYVFGRLDKRTQQLLNGEIKDASPAEIMAAQRTFENAIKKEKSDILQYTRGEVRSRALGARKGGAGASPSGSPSGVTRSRGDFNSAKFPGLRFD